MNWRLKAAIQNAISLLPKSLSYPAYYWVQRHFGTLKQPDVEAGLRAGVQTWRRLLAVGAEPIGKTFFEVGTGRMPLVPMSYWLMGAKHTTTVDLNPYLREDLTGEALDFIASNRSRVEALFGSLLFENRLDALISFYESRQFDLAELLDLCKITYVAPGDAAQTNLPDSSVDFHTSYNVFEHIPLRVLRRILEEGNRIVRKGGLFAHRIDYSDHFSHSDPSISAIHFLRFSDFVWHLYSGNRYMYMNRLRHDDFVEFFRSAGHTILLNEPDENPTVLKLLESGEAKLNRKFAGKTFETLSITGAWFVTRKET